MFRDLIVGYDASAPARDALAFARQLALCAGARPTVVCVRPTADLAAEVVDADNELVWGADIDGVLDDARALMRDVPGAAFEAVPATSVAEALHDAAERADAALIVLGSTHRCGIARILPGATAERVIETAPCPVAIAPAGYAQRAAPQPRGLIAAAVDGGPDTERVARVAGAIAAGANARLRLITVAEVPGGAGPASAGTIGYVTLANASRDRAASALDRAASAVGANVRVERRVAGGRVGGAIAKLSEDADLLVIGSRAYGPLRRVLAGTHTGSIVHAASAPVLVLPRGTSAERDEQLMPLAATSTA